MFMRHVAVKRNAGATDPARTAQQFLAQFWDQQLPVDPVMIARAAGVRVFSNPALGQDAGCYAGCYAWDDDAGPTIEYNPNEPPLRQRFALAHELGHFALNHGPRFQDPARSFSLSNRDPRAVAANQFAIELLMPSVVVNGLIVRHNVTDYERLASMFQTSTVAMKSRLISLNWL